MKKIRDLSAIVIGLLAGVLIASLFYVNPSKATAITTSQDQAIVNAALKTYVPHGKKDKYYLISSGGHSGQLFVYGVPSMRLLRVVPVFSPDPATGYGFDEETKKMLGGYKWGDFHHPAISETHGDYDGRAVFATDIANNRAAFISLKTFTTKDIIHLPNTAGAHCAAFVTPNSEYFFVPTRFSVPLGLKYDSLDNYKKDYHGVMSAIKPDFKNQKLHIAYQVMLPPWDYDLSDAGKGPSDGWATLSTYNTEEATTDLEINASQKDRDYLILFNWKEVAQEVAKGHYTMVNGVKMFDPSKDPGFFYLVPAPKSPHGTEWTPDGKYFLANGKLSPTVTLFSYQKAMEAIKNKDFTGTDHGMPILNYNDVLYKQVTVGLGPLHTVFDGRGNAYTSLFIDSEVAKWNIQTGKVIDKIPVSYAPGHLAAAEGDTMHPDGDYLVALNKIAKDDFLSVGPSHPESKQLIDISGEKMKLLYDSPSQPEPHYAQMIKADKIHTINVYPKDPNNPDAVYAEKDARIVRHGNVVDVYGTVVRSHYVFDYKAKRKDVINVNQGDIVRIHLTNLDRDEDITHGIAVSEYNENMDVQPGETKTMVFKAYKSGTFPVYCANFCSALHQELQGYLLVKPKQS